MRLFRKDVTRFCSEGSDLKFRIEDIEIELQIATTKGGKAGAGIKFWVYNAEAEVDASQVKTQKLKLKLKPKKPTGGDFDVNDQDNLGDWAVEVDFFRA